MFFDDVLPILTDRKRSFVTFFKTFLQNLIGVNDEKRFFYSLICTAYWFRLSMLCFTPDGPLESKWESFAILLFLLGLENQPQSWHFHGNESEGEETSKQTIVQLYSFGLRNGYTYVDIFKRMCHIWKGMQSEHWRVSEECIFPPGTFLYLKELF